jgi:hypothetical protein
VAVQEETWWSGAKAKKADLKSEGERHQETNPESRSTEEGVYSIGGASGTTSSPSRCEVVARSLKHQRRGESGGRCARGVRGFYLSIPDG